MADVGIQVVGLKELVREFRAADKRTGPEFRKRHLAAAKIIEAEAQRRAPRRRGRLARSIRAKATERSAQVVGGGARVPYFGLQEFGGTVPSRGNKGLGRARFNRARGRHELATGQRIRIKPYLGPSGPRTPWIEDDSGYFLFPGGRAKYNEAVNQYLKALDELTNRAFPHR